jgi:CheY-like chemotaxis protein
MMIATQVSKDHYYSYAILDKDTSFYHLPNENGDHYQHHHSQPHSSSSPPPYHLQNQESNLHTTTDMERVTKELSFLKKILIVDDDPDITLTFKVGLEEYSDDSNDNYNKRRFEIYTYNNPLEALSQLKPNFYDLMLTDINMPHMNGFELSKKVLELDANIRVCFISSAEVNVQALREVYSKVSFGCFIKKPVTIEQLVKRLEAELY